MNTICKIKESEISYKIVDYIYTNYNEDLNSKDVSNKFGINAIELNYHLKYLVEKNFECFLNYVRITKSVKLLLHTEDTISQIAYQVGYNSIRTFNRNFKKFYNTNPAKFRTQVQIQKNKHCYIENYIAVFLYLI
ncbi:helix-turn-helix domain-containing protein [Peptoniphilus olsenii]|uniref:helix-turn-helix domain-containing protein n=1 Tax=Peptoniphilus olsenii TaxID=411570 RepID=UPI0033926CEE